MYEKITDENGYQRPMRIYPAPHYSMGGLWVDYNLMSNIPGLFVLGEANFSVHGANRLGASALMQGLADGYFIIPYTIGGYLATVKPGEIGTEHAEFRKCEDNLKADINKYLSINGKKTVNEFMREVGSLMWKNCGMARSKESLETNLEKIPAIREEFWKNIRVTGSGDELNQQLENAGRTIDFMEFAELLCRDALHRNESCGGHFRVEYQDQGEARRDDVNYCYAGAWEFKGLDRAPELHREPLKFDNVPLAIRSYK
jgi:succinate dehydrogenase / fumarate reductase, flavoprotein subunit